jgi:hypothetical protein
MGAAAPDPTMPLLLIGQTRRRREVVAANATAIQAGLRIGMPATKAQALVKELVIHHAEPVADAEALERLAVWALRYSPVVAADDPDGLIIDATGASHLHGGEDAMLADMIARLEAVGIAARAAIADTRGAAHALARFAARPSLVVAERESAERIKPLPIAALRLAPDMVDDLRKLGFECIADLLATPRAPLTLRFGPELGRRIDQATGQTGEPIEPVRPPDVVEAQQLFRRTDRRSGNHRALRRQADCEAVPGTGIARSWRSTPRFIIRPGRQPGAGDPGRDGSAGSRRETIDAAAVRQDREGRPWFRHRDHAAGCDGGRTVRNQAGDLIPYRRAGGGRFRIDRHPVQPGRRDPSLSICTSGERRSGTVGAPGSRSGPGHRGWMADPLAPPCPVISPA